MKIFLLLFIVFFVGNNEVNGCVDQNNEVAEPPPEDPSNGIASAVNDLADSEPSISSDESETDEQLLENAIRRAEVNFDFIPCPQKVCHCHCQLNNGLRCIEQFTEEVQNAIKLNVQELTLQEKDILLLGVISCSINASDTTLKTRKKNEKRKLCRIRYFYYEHKRICRDTFLFLMDISKGKLNNLKKWYLEHGLVPRKKRSGGRQKTALSMEDIRCVTQFIINFADQHSLILPGRIPGFKRSDVRILPSCETKASIWRLYKSSAIEDQRVVKLSIFRKLWKQLLPFIVIGKPMSDLCWVCQRNNMNIVRAVNIPEEEKSEVLKKHEDHLRTATMQRSHYTYMCEQSRAIAKKYNLIDFRKSERNSLPSSFHYSFDYAQQVLFPANPMQPGPIYFKVPRRCQVFGIHAEGIGKQMNYLIDEAVTCGNGVISLLHHFLESYGLGEQHLELSADNCAGQNKNAYMMWYLCWRVVNGLHKSASISFMLTGHTKFAPDWCFGLFKRMYKRTFVSSLADIEQVVTKSTESGINKACLTGSENGDVHIPIYDWVNFLKPYFRKLNGIKSHHHFYFSAEKMGIVTMKEFSDSKTADLKLLTSSCPKQMPSILKPKGLDAKRQKYLYDEVREFCKEDTKDIVCPIPTDTAILASEISSSSETEEELNDENQVQKDANQIFQVQESAETDTRKSTTQKNLKQPRGKKALKNKQFHEQNDEVLLLQQEKKGKAKEINKSAHEKPAKQSENKSKDKCTAIINEEREKIKTAVHTSSTAGNSDGETSLAHMESRGGARNRRRNVRLLDYE